MAGIPKGGLAITGAVLAVLGGLALAIPVFTTEQTKEIAKVGDLKLTTKEETSHVIPRFVGPIALVIGLGLIGAAVVARR